MRYNITVLQSRLTLRMRSLVGRNTVTVSYLISMTWFMFQYRNGAVLTVRQLFMYIASPGKVKRQLTDVRAERSVHVLDLTGQIKLILLINSQIVGTEYRNATASSVPYLYH